MRVTMDRHVNQILFVFLCAAILCTLVVSFIFLSGVGISEKDKDFIDVKSTKIVVELEELNSNLDKVKDLIHLLELWTENAKDLKVELTRLNDGIAEYGGSLKENTDKFAETIEKLESLASTIQENPLFRLPRRQD